MRILTRKPRLAGVLAALLTALATSCANAVPEPTPAAETARPTAAGSPDKLLACLTLNDISASIRGADGEALVFEPVQWVVNRDQDGAVVVSYVEGTEELGSRQESSLLAPAGPVLVIDGQDHTIAYRACLEQSGHIGSATGGVYPANTDQLDALRQATVSWARCARHNGWADIADPAQTTATELPEAVIPSTITAGELDGLLRACPPFDADALAKARQAWEEGDANHQAPAFPNIAISPSDGTQKGEREREKLLDQLNQAQAAA
ncbi:MAG: hypothetical protein LBI99_10265 [Propionibacteriaceae bacterium]|jgi:hypothetical protein|nr:hypothetical protein [Propionibacteriaceae bacterium]